MNTALQNRSPPLLLLPLSLLFLLHPFRVICSPLLRIIIAPHLISSPILSCKYAASPYRIISTHPTVPSLLHFNASCEDSLISEINVPGPHTAGTVFLIAVDTYYGDGLSAKNTPPLTKSLRTSLSSSSSSSSLSLSTANMTSRYTILASYSQQHVLLISGQPQNHFMSKGGMVFFQFIPQDGYDLR